MSMDPSSIQSLLVQQLGSKPGQPGGVGGSSTPVQPQTSGANLVAQLAQKAVLMKALQNSQQQQAQTQYNAMQPAVQTQMANDPAMQALQQSPQLDPTLLAQLQQQPLAIPAAGGGATP